MPQYDYGCEGCGAEWEDFQLMKDAQLPLSQPCPQCSKLGSVKKYITKSTPVDPIVVNSGRMVDQGLKNTLDQMGSKYPGMQRSIG